MMLRDLAKVVRSKNAGPCLVTFDLIFDRPEAFAVARDSLEPLRREVALRYGLPLEAVRATAFEPALAVKITIPRRFVSGDPGDSDVYGAQQHGPLLTICLETA